MPLVEVPGALGERPGAHPVPAALRDERRLEHHVRDGEGVLQPLRELERKLDVLAGGLEVALAPRAA